MVHIMRIDEMVIKRDAFVSQRVNEMAVKPSLFNQYDEVDIFDSNYFKVMKDGLYNLFDRNGNPIGDVWFEEITKNNDGTFNATIKDDKNKAHTGTYSSADELERGIDIQTNVFGKIKIPIDIVLTDIIPIKPYTIENDVTSEKVLIIAKVKYKGIELLLGEDGTLYNPDGSKYVPVKPSTKPKPSAKPIPSKISTPVQKGLMQHVDNALLMKYRLSYNDETGLYDCPYNVYVDMDIVDNGKLIIKFGDVKGGFNCNNCELTSLEGAPQYVGGDFYCSNNNLTTLEGSPDVVNGEFDCSDNRLTSLEGSPLMVDGTFYCSNNNLTTLEGSPDVVNGEFDCSDNRLTSLEGAPNDVVAFYCSYNDLTSLKGAPHYVEGDFNCSNNNLTSLKGAPQKVGGGFDCSNCKLTSLKDAPHYVGGDFICYGNDLHSIDTSNIYIDGGDFIDEEK